MPPMKRKVYRRRRRVGKADMALRMVRKLNRSIEIKKVQEDYVNVPATTPINPGGVAVALTTVALGTDGYERVGEKISPKYINLRGLAYLNTASAFIRIIVVQHRQAQLASNLILQSTSAGAEMCAPYNQEWKVNFTVLWDKTLTIDSNNVGQQFRKRIKLRSPIYFNQGSSTPLRGGVTCYLFSSNSANTPYMNLAWEHCFTDA